MKSLLSLLLSLSVLPAVIGCGPSVSRDQVVTLQLEETTGLHPIRMTVNVDGADVFGPLGTVEPGQTKAFTLNDPAANQQIVGQHTVLYTFDRVGPVGAVGHARIQLLSNTQLILEDDSRKVLTGFAPTYSFRYVIGPAKD